MIELKKISDKTKPNKGYIISYVILGLMLFVVPGLASFIMRSQNVVRYLGAYPYI